MIENYDINYALYYLNLPLGLISIWRWCREPGVGTGLGLGQLNLEPSSSNCRTRLADGEPPAPEPSCCVALNCWDDNERDGKCLGLSIRRPASPSDDPNRLPLSNFKHMTSLFIWKICNYIIKFLNNWEKYSHSWVHHVYFLQSNVLEVSDEASHKVHWLMEHETARLYIHLK